jgi:uncharacterized RDD family membrane protein YckC
MPTKPVARKPNASAKHDVAPAVPRTGAPGEFAYRRFGLPAAYWRRGVARLLDMMAVFWLLFAFVVVGIAFWVHPLTNHVHPSPWKSAFIATVTYMVFLVIYEVVFLVHRGQTPGKDFMRIKVVRSLDGANPTVNQAIRRSLASSLFVLVPTVWLAAVAQVVVALPALTEARRRTLGDRVAGTQVVYYDDPEGRPAFTLWDRSWRARYLHSNR